MTYTWTSDNRPLPQPRRYGIIPCRRCAFFDIAPNALSGNCMRHVDERPKNGLQGCGDGLLREEAAPLPPEQQESNQ